ncbi:MAG TPA: 2-hydroxyglutaryl-CoA dehydratase [Polyangia bacterium]|nr:2-hydroxyglutaryl-CoA dehydratase [Polyangia bacterium]
MLNETEIFPSVDQLANLDVDAELAKFEAEARRELGLDGERSHWRDVPAPDFTASQRAKTTILVSGLTMAHDFFVQGALAGQGYVVQHMDCPDNDALRFGKEFGNRAQCNPTYFTVGNLVKYLVHLRDEKGLATDEINDRYVFLTAGACGPCRFGMYATEYRKALRDAGFDGFRVILFQQTGGLKQATGEEKGLKMDPPFFIAILKALLAGDVLNAMMYRIRPYEVEAGAANRAVEQCKKVIYEHLNGRKSIFVALNKARRILEAVKVDRTMIRPKVSIIGEFWAMTTEGDGNYQLQKFLEQEGGECDIQLVTAWLLYMIWEQRWDTQRRMMLRGTDDARRGLATVDVRKKMIGIAVAERAVRAIFQAFAHAIGLYDYHLPDMNAIAEVAQGHYANELRGGEGHMEVGKLILNVTHKKATMTISVKPFGCMPSSGVSDGVQTIITEKYPEAIFLPIETSGDGAVNVQSRVQMMMFKARLAAKAEVEEVCAKHGVTLEQVRDYVAKSPRFRDSLYRARHLHRGCTTANLVEEVAPRMRSRWKRMVDRLPLPPVVPATV